MINAVTAKRFSIEEYHQLIKLNFIKEDDRIELIEGELIEMVAKGFRHCACTDALNIELIKLLGDRAVIRSQNPIALADRSEPEPDLAIVSGRAQEFFTRHPTASDVILVIEVSDSTLSYDQTTKLKMYANAGINHYWIVNLQENQLETYSEPYTHRGIYGTSQIYLPDRLVTIPAFEVTLNLDSIFPVSCDR
jgi:Uma2 family endonuclease